MTGNIKLGNPAPLGLFAFGVTTAMLMYVDMQWVEKDFVQFVAAYAMFYGGLCQLIVAIFELFKGSSFSFAVFGSYGAFWLGWALIVFETHKADSTLAEMKDYTDGQAAWLASFGVLSCCFFAIVIRKNLALIVTFGLLIITFFLLSAAAATGNATTKHVAGYFGFFTAVGAWYTGAAELINEEYGYMVLPGLKPLIVPGRFKITVDSMQSRITYDNRTNTLFISFRSLQIKSSEDVQAIHDSVEGAILKAKAPNNKIHVIVDYNECFIGNDIFDQYWDMVEQLQNQYYLSATRFHVSSMGTGLRSNAVVEAGLKSALAERDTVNHSNKKSTLNSLQEKAVGEKEIKGCA